MAPSWYRTLENRVNNIISRALVRKTEDGEVQVSAVSVTSENDMKDVERLQNYGLSSCPGPDADGLVVNIGGDQEYPVVIGADHPEIRKRVKEWEVAIWSKFGQWVHFKEDGSIEIFAPDKISMKSTKAELDYGPELKIKSQKLSVTGSAGELISILSQFMDEVSKIVSDPVSPGNPASFGAFKVKIEALKLKFDQFKV